MMNQERVDTQGQVTTTTLTIDTAHSIANFAIKHMMVANVRGQFSGITGTITGDEHNPLSASVHANLNTGTVDTGDEKRDAHLRSPDFFDANQFPAITFISKRIEQAGHKRFKVYGDLTIRNVTREIVLETAVEGPIRDPWGKERYAFEAQTTINRKDFGLNWNMALEAGGFLVGDDVKITLDVQAVKQ